jgi:hypothetical protein
MPAFFIAATLCSIVNRGVVLIAFNAPPADTAIEKAAASILSGNSMISTASYSPKANQKPSTQPPAFSITARTA